MSGSISDDDEVGSSMDSDRLRTIVSDYVIPGIAGVLLVFVVLALVFAILGVWPPLFNVVSGSMEPNVPTGSFVVGKEPGRFEPAPAIDTHRNSEVENFGKTGDVVAYRVRGGSTSDRLMILHRVMFYVEKGENWYQEANSKYLLPGTDSCKELANCPAPHSGYITKGDANQVYDQARGISTVVKSDWVHAEIIFIIPLLGYLQLTVAAVALITAVMFVFYLIYVIFREILSSTGSSETDADTL